MALNMSAPSTNKNCKYKLSVINNMVQIKIKKSYDKRSYNYYSYISIKNFRDIKYSIKSKNCIKIKVKVIKAKIVTKPNIKPNI